jgi:magnesium-transporting ATPase (P-type)
MTGSTAVVEKMGTVINIPGDDLRRGDLLLLQAGDLVPADVRLIPAKQPLSRHGR